MMRSLPRSLRSNTREIAKNGLTIIILFADLQKQLSLGGNPTDG